MVTHEHARDYVLMTQILCSKFRSDPYLFMLSF